MLNVHQGRWPGEGVLPAPINHVGTGGLRLSPPSSDRWHTVTGLIKAESPILTLALHAEKGRSAYFSNVTLAAYFTQPVAHCWSKQVAHPDPFQLDRCPSYASTLGGLCLGLFGWSFGFVWWLFLMVYAFGVVVS